MAPDNDVANEPARAAGKSNARAKKKVELDLDDAPFLVDDIPVSTPKEDVLFKEQPPIAPPKQSLVRKDEDDSNVVPIYQKKWFLAVLSLITVLVIVSIFVDFQGAEKTPEDPLVRDPNPFENLIKDDSTPPPSTVDLAPVKYPLEAFSIPVLEDDTNQRFIEVKLALELKGRGIDFKIDEHLFVLRNLMYYILSGHNLEFYQRNNIYPTIENEIQWVINAFMLEILVTDVAVEYIDVAPKVPTVFEY